MMGLEMSPGSDLFDYCEALCRYQLRDQNVDELGIIDILAERFEERQDDEVVKDILGTKECAEGFGEEEVKVLDNWKKKT